jgi:hypothetical protein
MIVIVRSMPVAVVVVVFAFVAAAPILDASLPGEIHGPLGGFLGVAGCQR